MGCNGPSFDALASQGQQAWPLPAPPEGRAPSPPPPPRAPTCGDAPAAARPPAPRRHLGASQDAGHIHIRLRTAPATADHAVHAAAARGRPLGGQQGSLRLHLAAHALVVACSRGAGGKGGGRVVIAKAASVATNTVSYKILQTTAHLRCSARANALASLVAAPPPPTHLFGTPAWPAAAGRSHRPAHKEGQGRGAGAHGKASARDGC